MHEPDQPPLKLTKTEAAAFLGHQARERELAAEFQDVLREIAERLGIAAESIGRDYALDTRTWEFLPIPKAGSPDA